MDESTRPSSTQKSQRRLFLEIVLTITRTLPVTIGSKFVNPSTFLTSGYLFEGFGSNPVVVRKKIFSKISFKFDNGSYF